MIDALLRIVGQTDFWANAYNALTVPGTPAYSAKQVLNLVVEALREKWLL